MPVMMTVTGPGLEIHFDRLLRFMHLMRIDFDRSVRGPWRILNYTIFILILAMAVYQLSFSLIVTVVQKYNATKVSQTLVVCNWHVQSIISMYFLLQWRRSGQLERYMALLASAQRNSGCMEGRRMLDGIVRRFYVVVGFMVALCSFYAYTFLTQQHFVVANRDLDRVYFHPRLRAIQSAVSLYVFICWNLALFTYRFTPGVFNDAFSLLINGAFLEIRHFNRRIKKTKACCGDELCAELIELMETHNRLAESVRSLNKMFEVYAFIMIGTNIPTSIFSLLQLASTPFTWIGAIAVAPSLFFCAYGFMGLTAAPARLHKAIHQSKENLCANRNVWFPYRPDVYRIASAFMSHLEQANLGISIWGFAIVSKPLILTVSVDKGRRFQTCSVMVTCLALLLEFKRTTGTHVI